MREAPHEPDALATDRTAGNSASRKGIGPSLTRPARGAQMRTLAALLAVALPALAAPVPKELRKHELVGTWEITTSNVWGGGPSDQYNGQRWRFAESGVFTITERGQPKPRLTGSFTQTADGMSILYGERGVPAKSLYERDDDTLRLANTKLNGQRAADLRPSADAVIYTFKRVKD